MEVVFQSNSRILGYRPGQIIRAELTGQLHALLARGRHLTLIDPPTLEQLKAGVSAAPVTPHPEIDEVPEPVLGVVHPVEKVEPTPFRFRSKISKEEDYGESSDISEATGSSVPEKSTSRTRKTGSERSE